MHIFFLFLFLWVIDVNFFFLKKVSKSSRKVLEKKIRHAQGKTLLFSPLHTETMKNVTNNRKQTWIEQPVLDILGSGLSKAYECTSIALWMQAAFKSNTGIKCLPKSLQRMTQHTYLDMTIYSIWFSSAHTNFEPFQMLNKIWDSNPITMH